MAALMDSSIRQFSSQLTSMPQLNLLIFIKKGNPWFKIQFLLGSNVENTFFVHVVIY